MSKLAGAGMGAIIALILSMMLKDEAQPPKKVAKYTPTGEIAEKIIAENDPQEVKTLLAAWDRLLALEKQEAELRWEIDDLKLRNRSPEELEKATKASKDNPSAAVMVSGDYPKWRLPYGVKIDDQRPPEVVAAAVERCKAGKGVVYMWLSFDQPDGREFRVYMDKIDWRDPKEAK